MHKVELLRSIIVKMMDSGKTLHNDTHKWTEGEVEYLIDLYRSKPCLRDIFSKDYAKRDIKEKVWNVVWI